jgi:archaellum component FlaC
MGTSEKQGVTKRPQTAMRKDGVPVNVTPLRDDMLAASQAFVRQKIHEKRNYLRAAFANPYNLSLLAGGLVASALTLNPLLAVITVGLEILWVVNAPGSKKLQEWLFDPSFDEDQRKQEEAARAERLKNLDEESRDRVVSLLSRQQEINSLAAQNPSFTGELLRTELTKTNRLVEAFIEMATTCSRYEAYLNSVNAKELERERRRWEEVVKDRDEGGPETDIARKNLAVIMKRFDKMKEIHHYLRVARGQLDLIEHSFQLIADQIVTMQSPQELTGQLDELLDGVESIKQTAADTERMLNPLGLKDLNTHD